MIAKPMFLATAIGSMPFDDPGRAVDLILSSLPEAPHWPQLPRLGLNEQMEIQFSEHMPCAVIDREKNRRLLRRLRPILRKLSQVNGDRGR